MKPDLPALYYEGKSVNTGAHVITTSEGEAAEIFTEALTDEQAERLGNMFAAAPAMLAALEADPTKCDHKFPHLSACYCCQRDAAISQAKGS